MIDYSLFNKKYEHTFILTNEVFKAFQICSGDYNPLHNDISFAKEKGFNNCVMYGNILNGFLSYFIGMMLPSQDVIIHSQDIAYKNPVYMNEELYFSALVSCIFEAVNAIEFRYSFRNTDNKIVAKGHIQIGIIK